MITNLDESPRASLDDDPPGTGHFRTGVDDAVELMLRWLPPPAVVALPVRLLPDSLHRLVIERLLNRLLVASLGAGGFDFLRDRYLALEVSDMKLRWVLTFEDERLTSAGRDHRTDATIRGDAVDFLMLAGRQEDPDTLFFQRRLAIHGDTEVGLTARNLLDRLEWAVLPLGVRILLNRAGRLGRRIRKLRDAHGPALTMPGPPRQ